VASTLPPSTASPYRLLLDLAGRSTPKDLISTVGRFPRSAAAPLGRNVAAGGGPTSLDSRVRALPPGPILGHQRVAWDDGWPMEEV
jgi:hypothetical protein